MNSLAQEFKGGMYRIGNFVVHIITNPITTLEGIRLNWDALQHPTEIKVFLSGLIGLMVFAAMPDDVIRNGVTSFNNKFRKPAEVVVPPTPIIEEGIESNPPPELEPITTTEETVLTQTASNYEHTNPLSLSTSRTYKPSRLRGQSA